MPTDADGRPRMARAAAFVCMVPAEGHLRANPELGRQRAALVERSCTMTHWPQEASAKTVVSQGPPGSVQRKAAKWKHARWQLARSAAGWA